MKCKVAIIPARAGSKRLPGKNSKLLGDKPLIAWTINAAFESDIFDEIIFTSDDKELLKKCENFYNIGFNKGLKIIDRPEELAQDDTTLDKVILHALKGYSLDTVVFLLPPTCPFRSATDIKMCDLIWETHKPLPIVSVYWKGGISGEIRINTGIYISDLVSLILGKGFTRKFTVNYYMPYERSVDIDTFQDWNEAERVLKEGIVK